MARSLAICVVTLLTIGSMTLIVEAENSTTSIFSPPSSTPVSSPSSARSSTVAPLSTVASSSSVSPSIAPTSSFGTSSLAAPSSPGATHSSRMSSPSLSISHVSKSVLTSTILTSSESLPVNPSTVATTSYFPSSSPSPPSPPSPTPPAPTEQYVHFNDTKKPNVSCLLAQFSVSFEVAYTSNKMKRTSHIPLNGHHKAHGNCSFEDGNATLVIYWNEAGGETVPKHKFVMKFKLDSKKKQWSVPLISATFNTSDSRFIDANKKVIFAHGNGNGNGSIDFVQSKESYVCKSSLMVQMNGVANATFTKLKLQPFSTDPNFNSAGKECPADKSHDDDNSNTVPIAVGAALGGLVLIVLVAYIIGRRRSKSGYEQV